VQGSIDDGGDNPGGGASEHTHGVSVAPFNRRRKRACFDAKAPAA
jgi:hypothetical protein